MLFSIKILIVQNKNKHYDRSNPEYLAKNDSTISSQNAEFNYFDNQISEQSIRLNHQFPLHL